MWCATATRAMHCARPFSIGVDDPDPADHRQRCHPIVRRIHDAQNHEREVGERNEGKEAVPDEGAHWTGKPRSQFCRRDVERIGQASQDHNSVGEMWLPSIGSFGGG